VDEKKEDINKWGYTDLYNIGLLVATALCKVDCAEAPLAQLLSHTEISKFWDTDSKGIAWYAGK